MVLAGFHLSAQTINDDFTKINSVYALLKEYSVNISYTLYADYTTLNEHSSESGILVKSGEKQYLKIASVELISDSGFQLMVDNDNKLLMYRNIILPSKQANQVVDFSKALSLCTKTTLLQFNDTRKGYKLDFVEGIFDEYAALSVIYDTTNYMIGKVILFYAVVPDDYNDELTGKPRMEITYTGLKKEVSVLPALLNKENYITEDNNTLKLTEKYKNFRLIDNRIK